ncbi:hypothetical protein [Streptomyces sp. SLBN-31]|uniref:hypothetical protein n=1 Tax=Streptomyces sp. SLBN-31 TaxID=2768444 RepID=UPI00114F4F4A|nr:hypothetical protein [Streptomyces sp. SLBN-31]
MWQYIADRHDARRGTTVVVHRPSIVENQAISSRNIQGGTVYGPVFLPPEVEELVWAAEEAAQRSADDDADFLPDETGHLSTEEERLVAKRSADTVNLTLARLFVRLGPPPLNANGEGLAPVSSGDGGSPR